MSITTAPLTTKSGLVVDVDALASLPLYEIASIIRSDWRDKTGQPNVHGTAKPYLEALESLESVNDCYGADKGKYIIAYFLNNAASWRGDVAKVIKAHLKKIAK